MLPEERRIKIINVLKENGKVEVEELSQKLKVSPMTIRRDLAYLEEKGIVLRTHGGAVYSNILNYEIPYINKEVINKAEKERIGKKAAEFVKEGQSIILDAGTTCLEVAKNLKYTKDITVITNDIKIAIELYTNSNIKVFCTGGLVQSNVGALIGNYAEEFIQSINVDYAFIGVSSIDEEYMVSTPTVEKSFLKKKMIQSANKSVLLADHSKFNKRSLAKICSISEVDILITDSLLDEKIVKDIKELVTQLYLV
ncbi:MAG: hypothetical protein PWP71_2494 [Clostridia bacterium]|nr:hypothetical protein [Clostridia bacterium]